VDPAAQDPASPRAVQADSDGESGQAAGLFVGPPGMDAAEARARGLLPTHHRIPKKGEVFEATGDVPVHYHTTWRAPYTGGGDAILGEGDRIVITSVSDQLEPEPVGVGARAVDYDAIEQRIVPASVRTAAKYSGYNLWVEIEPLNCGFRLVSEE
jgi:hypothetical protein